MILVSYDVTRQQSSGSSDNTVRVWNPTTGALYKILEGHSDWVRSVAFSPDGCLLASGSYDQTVRIWDFTAGTANQILKGHSGLVCFLAFSPDGRLLASGSSDRTVRIWDVATDPKTQAHESHSGPVRSVAFSPDGLLLASGSDDGTVRLWDPATGVLHQTTNVRGVATQLDFSADSSRLNTNLGSFDIEPCSKNPDSKHLAKVEILMQDDQWITLDGEKALWLPPDYRPTCSAVKDNTFALGHASGQVSFIGFDA
ncbi:WD40-repeat-containing domain protein [Penicillium bovifimosum]|uniref:WD40-repeat-containing domain protein n=1 Tax=Penicillium bovifimosum TaxID=126998 RepID=A0A9W9KUS6_9EURO|nr:WD40-repeat-containing domain protein [Penicillium bovifimosum]KAJ5120353.1 WD40-repeat-containing domain protein [Penicillium bovifimosum]